MKKSDLFYTAILMPLDYLVLILAGILVYFLRFRILVELRPVVYQLAFSKYLVLILINSAVWIGVFVLVGLYNAHDRRQFSKEIPRIFNGCSVGTMIIVLFIFFSQNLLSSRFIVLAYWLISFIFISLSHFFIHQVKIHLYKKGKGLEPILIFGQGKETERIISNLRDKPEFGYKVLGRYQSTDNLITDWQNRAFKISQIIQTDPDLSKEENLKLIGFCNEHQIIFKYITDLFGALSSNVRTETLTDMPVVEIQRTALQDWGKIYKRIFDFILSTLGLAFFSPFFFFIGLIIKLDSSGPVLVTLVRIGERGKPFKLYKFRSMIKNAHQMKDKLLKYNERGDILFKMEHDPRITQFGRILRQTSLDELPQLINIIKGEMSLVGPRPHESREIKQYERQYKQLLTIKPGLTGLAQISGRSDLLFEQEAKLDIYYVENWSISLDLQILIKTVRVVLLRKNVS